jgi:hypothetical protein
MARGVRFGDCIIHIRKEIIMTGTTCTKCGAQNRAGAKFCANCRSQLAIPPAAQPQVPPRPAPQSAAPQTPRVPQGAPQQIPPRPPPRPTAPAQAQGKGCAGWIKNKWVWVAAGAMMLTCICLALVIALSGKIPGLAQATPTMTAVAIAPTRLLPPPPPATPTLSQPLAEPTITRLPSSPTPHTPSPTLVTPTTRPTTAPTTVPQPTPVPTETHADAVLQPGQSWRATNQVMALQNPKFAVGGCDALFEFEVTYKNWGNAEVFVDLRGEDFNITDDAGKKYETVFYWQGTKPADCAMFNPLARLAKNALDKNEEYKVSFQVRSTARLTAQKFVFHVAKAGKITNAKWEIVVPR